MYSGTLQYRSNNQDIVSIMKEAIASQKENGYGIQFNITDKGLVFNGDEKTGNLVEQLTLLIALCKNEDLHINGTVIGLFPEYESVMLLKVKDNRCYEVSVPYDYIANFPIQWKDVHIDILSEHIK